MRRPHLRPSINEQLNIGVPRNPNIPSRYARGLSTIQPQLGSEDWSLDFYNDIDSLRNFSNRNEWDSGSYSSADGEARRKACKFKCNFVRKSRRADCFKACDEKVERLQAEKEQDAMIDTGSNSTSPTMESASYDKVGMSSGAKIGIAVGAVVVLGVVGYLIMRKK
jgi:hypothetical protein